MHEADDGADALYLEASGRFASALDRLAVAYEADPEKRRDLLQEIHAALWHSLARFDGRCSLRTWVYRVAHNTAGTHVTREMRRNAEHLVDIEELALMRVEGDQDWQVDERRTLERLERLIRQLKPLDRQVMHLYLEDLDAEAIGEITGLSPGSVATRIHRTKVALARHFEQGGRNG